MPASSLSKEVRDRLSKAAEPLRAAAQADHAMNTPPPPPAPAAPPPPAAAPKPEEKTPPPPEPKAKETPPRDAEGKFTAPEPKPEPKEDSNWKAARGIMESQRRAIEEAQAKIRELEAKIPKPPEPKDPLADLSPEERDYWKGKGRVAVQAILNPLQREMEEIKATLQREREATTKQKELREEFDAWKKARGISEEEGEVRAEILAAPEHEDILKTSRHWWEAFERADQVARSSRAATPPAAHKEETAAEREAREAAKRRATGVMGASRSVPETTTDTWRAQYDEAVRTNNRKDQVRLMRARLGAAATPLKDQVPPTG